MNKVQKEYAVSRIDGMLAEKEAAVREANTKRASVISAEERVALIKSGAVTLAKKVKRIESYTNVVDVFDFSAHCWPDTVDMAAVNRIMAPFRDEAQSLKDKIMLGDETTALQALEVFRKKVK